MKCRVRGEWPRYLGRRERQRVALRLVDARWIAGPRLLRRDACEGAATIAGPHPRFAVVDRRIGRDEIDEAVSVDVDVEVLRVRMIRRGRERGVASLVVERPLYRIQVAPRFGCRETACEADLRGLELAGGRGVVFDDLVYEPIAVDIDVPVCADVRRSRRRRLRPVGLVLRVLPPPGRLEALLAVVGLIATGAARLAEERQPLGREGSGPEATDHVRGP